YLYSFWLMWSVAIVLLLFAIWQGWRHAPLLLATAVANIAFHSVIGHKEYRFIFLSVALFIIIAALGAADWVQWLRTKPAWRRWALPPVAGGWALISGALAATGTMPDNWVRGTGAAEPAAATRRPRGHLSSTTCWCASTARAGWPGDMVTSCRASARRTVPR